VQESLGYQPAANHEGITEVLSPQGRSVNILPVHYRKIARRWARFDTSSAAATFVSRPLLAARCTCFGNGDNNSNFGSPPLNHVFLFGKFHTCTIRVRARIGDDGGIGYNRDGSIQPRMVWRKIPHSRRSFEVWCRHSLAYCHSFVFSLSSSST
jgi:hypothetical protein